MDASRASRRELLIGGAHLSGLSGLAFAQPLFDLLQGEPSALIATDATGLALVLLVAGVALGPPLLLMVVEAIALPVSRGLARPLHLLFIGGLVALLLLQAHVAIHLSEGLLVLLAAAAGVLAAELYRRSHTIRFGLSVLAPAPLLFAALFLVSPAISPLVHASEASVGRSAGGLDAPVVLIVFDELPLPSLLDRRARIDSARYPAFARLARDGTWFSNTTSVDGSTPSAVPAILSGERPDSQWLPFSADYPRSIFTLLGPGRDPHVIEPLTRICPRELCRRDQRSALARAWTAAGLLSQSAEQRLLPGHMANGALRVTRRLQRLLRAGTAADYLTARVEERRGDFGRFAASIRAEGRPGLYVLHALLPHGPWEFLPSGRRYQAELHGLVDGRWAGDRDLVAQGWQRHLLQLEYTDRLLSAVLDRLRRVGLYDKALIAVTADHGVNFAPNGQRRGVDSRSVRQLAPVPFILKGPRQRHGEIREVALETVDVLPTIADRLGVRLPAGMDGVSGFRPALQDQGPAAMSEAGKGRFTVRRELLARGGATLARKLALFGSGRDRRPLFTLGSWSELVGRRLRPGTPQVEHSTRVRLTDPERFESVSLAAPTVPAEVEGTFAGASPGWKRDLAIAVNGRIGAVTRSYRSAGGARFAAVLPDWALRPGRNEVTVLTVRRRAGHAVLARLPEAR